jgi:hypothetical protein
VLVNAILNHQDVFDLFRQRDQSLGFDSQSFERSVIETLHEVSSNDEYDTDTEILLPFEVEEDVHESEVEEDEHESEAS